MGSDARVPGDSVGIATSRQVGTGNGNREVRGLAMTGGQ